MSPVLVGGYIPEARRFVAPPEFLYEKCPVAMRTRAFPMKSADQDHWQLLNWNAPDRTPSEHVRVCDTQAGGEVAFFQAVTPSP
jgi:hypothetical protein